MSTPRSNNKSSTFRKLSGNRIYIMTTSRITSGEELKYLNGLAGLRGRGIRGLYIAPVTKGCIWFDSAASRISNASWPIGCSTPARSAFIGGPMLERVNISVGLAQSLFASGASTSLSV
jgi:hypothetical protein